MAAITYYVCNSHEGCPIVADGQCRHNVPHKKDGSVYHCRRSAFNWAVLSEKPRWWVLHCKTSKCVPEAVYKRLKKQVSDRFKPRSLLIF